MAVREIFSLGNPALYEVSADVEPDEIEYIRNVVGDLHDTMMDFRSRYGAGRAIAAPQVGVMKRLIYMNVDGPLVFINPVIGGKSEEMMEVWDDCMCFPGLLVKVKRHRRCRIDYLDLDWNRDRMDLEDDLSELLQHEHDHLDGILAVMRAVEAKSFALKSQRRFLKTGEHAV